MDNLQLFKEKQINDYLSSVDVNTTNANIIKEELSEILGEKPAVWFNYEQQTLINEDGSKVKKLERLKSITITFTYEKNINGQTIPFPVKKNYILQ